MPTGGGGSPSLSSGQVTSAAAAILMVAPVDPDENGNCPDGYEKNPATGKCESICTGGKFFNETTKKCECPEGLVEDDNGNCIAKPCVGNPVKGSLEIAPQKGKSGTLGAMFGNSITGGCKRYGASDCTTPRNKKHDGIDIKSDYGDPIFAMYDGFIYSSKDDRYGAGYYTRIQSTTNGVSIITSYFHLQKENRLLATNPLHYVKAGDIIGYQGDSGNLKNAISDGGVDSHVHIETRKHDESTSWGYSHFDLVDPRDYFETTIDSTGVSQSNTNCN
jgi:murein DD-endopeptidase MepM/ murein hydrolase activator NlpD